MTLAPGQRRTRSRSSLLQPRTDQSPGGLQTLRDLIAGPPADPMSPEVVGRVLPEAIAQASQARADDIATAFNQPVARALRDVARREPELFGEILAPTIGTAVRRAVSDALAAIIDRMNQLLERTLSVRSFAWRLEAKRTGRPFADVVLAHTLLYRAEWVVLIHTETSLVLDQASLPDSAGTAPDQISAMLQAISTFVSEAFRPTVPGGDLSTLQVGDLTLWIDRDPAITLAVALRGAAPVELRNTFRQTLARIRTLHPLDIAEHQPDLSKFCDVQPLLLDCLQQRLKPAGKKAQWVLAIGGVAIALLIAVLAVRAHSEHHARDVLRAQYEDALSSTPGIIVTSIERDGDRYRIEGLRDPRAKPAEMIIAAAGLPAATLELAPFDSLDPGFDPPLAVADAAIRELEAIVIPFEHGSMSVLPSELPAIERAAQLVQRTQRAAAAANASVCIAILGDTDEAGSAVINDVLRPGRATSVATALQQAGVETSVLDPRAVEPSRARHQRNVSFRAGLRPGADRPGCPP